MAEAAVRERSAWAGLAAPGRFGASGREPGVVLAEGDTGPTVLLVARRGAEPTTARSVGVALPRTPAFLRQNGRLFVWAGPGQWWVRGAVTVAALEAEFGPQGFSAVDLGDARAVLSVSGPRARDALAKGFEIDLHPRTFRVGDVALTAVAGVPATVWQTDEHPTYEIAVPRSYAGSFWHWLTGAAAEFGFRVEEARVNALG